MARCQKEKERLNDSGSSQKRLLIGLERKDNLTNLVPMDRWKRLSNQISEFPIIGKERSGMAKRIIDRERVRELYNQGMTCSEIAKEVGCGAPAVSKIIKTIRGGPGKPAPVAITDVRLLFLFQAIYGDVWRVKRRNWEGAPRELVLQRLRSLIGVINA